MERRLGKGLGSLLGETHTQPPAPEVGAGAVAGRSDLMLGSIEPNPFQPRKVIDPESLEELRTSILNHGVLQPIVVRPHGRGYQLIAGERRWRAAKLAQLTHIPASVREGVSDQDMLELALVENVQRSELNPIERAEGYRQLQENLALTQEQVAAKVGLQRATVTNHLRLLELPAKVQQAVGEGLIGMGHARALLGLPGTGPVLKLLEATVREDLSVREVERRVRSLRPGTTSSQAAPKTPWVGALEIRLRDALGTQATLRGAEAGKGRIEIAFHSRDELDRLCERIAPKDLL